MAATDFSRSDRFSAVIGGALMVPIEEAYKDYDRDVVRAVKKR